MSLDSFGADSRVHALFQSHAAPGLVLARVVTSQQSHCRIVTADGEFDAQPSGALRHDAGPGEVPVTGDWVAARPVNPQFALVESILPRRSVFTRKSAGRAHRGQPVAANIDLALLLLSLDDGFNLRRLERYLVLTAEAAVDAIVVLTKADLQPDPAPWIHRAAAIARHAWVIAVSTRIPGALAPLAEGLAAHRTAVLLGASGAGKSSIVNALLDENRFLTQPVLADSRGRHTTTRGELVRLPSGGILIDTPGMRELGLWAGMDSVNSAFDDIAAIAARCRFRDCSHSGDLGCAIEAALATGALPPDRWASYAKLAAEARHHERESSHLAAARDKRNARVIERELRRRYRERGRP